MNRIFWLRAVRMGMALGCLAGCLGCASPKADWNARIGKYTYDQAVIDLGPPERSEKLTNGVVVAEWLTRQGYTSIPAPYGFGYPAGWPYPYGPIYTIRNYGPPYAGYWIPVQVPDQWLRLVFGENGELKQWKRFDK